MECACFFNLKLNYLLLKMRDVYLVLLIAANFLKYLCFRCDRETYVKQILKVCFCVFSVFVFKCFAELCF
jgi:hypothetical protein